MSFFRELRRRNVYRVGAAYVIVGWLIIQIATSVFPQLQLPPWTATLVTVLVALGFPVALLLAWAFELTPEGIRPSRSADAEAPVGSGRPLDYALLAGLVLVAGALLISSLRSIPSGGSAGEAADAVLIAIMPFEDQSPDGGYEWLGRGIPSELRNGLGRVAGIEIAPPSFGFSFDDSDAIAIIDYVVEGSIRSDGETLRVSASLTNVKERRNDPLLQENYPASEAFTIQEDLATRILSLIGVRLGVQDVNAFAGAGTTDRDAYENYLRGISILTSPAASEFLREAVRIDPLYANAWAQLALSSTAQKWVVEQPNQMLPFTAQGLEYALRAHDLQPESAEVLSMLGTMYYGSNDWLQGHEYHLSALSIRRNPIALTQSGMLLHRAGNSSDALRCIDEAAEFTSSQLSGSSPFQHVVMLIQLRRYGEARELSGEMSLEERLDAELMLNLSAGTREEVRQSIAAMASQSVAGLRNAERGEAASRLYRPLLAVFDDPSAALSLLRELHAEEDSWPSKWHDIGRLAAWFGDAQFAFELVAEEARNGSPRRFGLWMPYMADVRALPEFRELVEEINLVEFWERYGWGDFCRGSAAEFSCED